jgi:hypothetical protein
MTRKRKCVIMAGVDDDGPIRTSWFGMGGRPQLPHYFRSKRGKRVRRPLQRPQRARRLKGLDEFEPPPWKGRMDRIARRRKFAWWAMMAGAAAVGAGLGLVLF